MNNDLASNQQASWTDDVVTTCCTSEASTECWFRIQANTPSQDACKIPLCDDLLSNDPARMLSFRPLSGSIGDGKYQNIFPLLFVNGAAKPLLSLTLFVLAPLAASLLLFA